MQWLALIISIVFCQLAGAIGAVFTIKAIPTWYAGLRKPSFQPPNAVFGPVWTVLYVLMGIVGWRLWITLPASSVAFAWFCAQLVLNALWTPLFFGARRIGWSFLEIVVQGIAVIVTVATSFAVDPLAAALLLPLLLWVTFAAVLNGAIWRLNPASM